MAFKTGRTSTGGSAARVSSKRKVWLYGISHVYGTPPATCRACCRSCFGRRPGMSSMRTSPISVTATSLLAHSRAAIRAAAIPPAVVRAHSRTSGAAPSRTGQQWLVARPTNQRASVDSPEPPCTPTTDKTPSAGAATRPRRSVWSGTGMPRWGKSAPDHSASAECPSRGREFDVTGSSTSFEVVIHGFWPTMNFPFGDPWTG